MRLSYDVTGASIYGQVSDHDDLDMLVMAALHVRCSNKQDQQRMPLHHTNDINTPALSLFSYSYAPGTRTQSRIYPWQAPFPAAWQQSTNFPQLVKVVQYFLLELD